MSGKIKVIIKRPDETYGHVTNISPSLANLQRIVDGHIEINGINGLLIICNEEGKLRRMEPNFLVPFDYICGPAIICGKPKTDADTLGDVPISFADWKDLLMTWGNE